MYLLCGKESRRISESGGIFCGVKPLKAMNKVIVDNTQ